MTNLELGLENLLLASLLVERSKNATLAVLLEPKSFRDLFRHRWSEAQLTREAEAAVARLAAQELLQVAKNNVLLPTESGRERAKIFLSLKKDPKLSWDVAKNGGISIRRGYLPAKA